MRLINADALMDSINIEWNCGGCIEECVDEFGNGNCLVHLFKESVFSSPTIPQWIPVSERLPNDGELVLLTFEGSEKVDMETAIYDVKYGFSTSDRFALDYGIIAWMPLPEPYKKGDNNER